KKKSIKNTLFIVCLFFFGFIVLPTRAVRGALTGGFARNRPRCQAPAAFGMSLAEPFGNDL
ncbi:hypothetical protein, partial [Saccharopolyspora sp. NPDC003762]